MEYELLYGNSSIELTTNVNMKLQDGWELYGVTFSERFSFGVCFYQTVIKKQPKKSVGIQDL
jgi:hypothetical protein